MPVTAEGSICLAEEHFANLLANLSEFRSWLGVGTVEAAKAKIFFDWVPTTEDYPWVLAWTKEFDREAVAGGSVFEYEDSGEIVAWFNQTVPQQYEANVGDAERVFKNSLGKIFDQIRDLTGTGHACEPLTVIRARLVEIERHRKDVEDKSLGKVQEAMVSFLWSG